MATVTDKNKKIVFLASPQVAEHVQCLLLGLDGENKGVDGIVPLSCLLGNLLVHPKHPEVGCWKLAPDRCTMKPSKSIAVPGAPKRDMQ
jgi:hypothetical protein